jgi:hypothetical protein
MRKIKKQWLSVCGSVLKTWKDEVRRGYLLNSNASLIAQSCVMLVN